MISAWNYTASCCMAATKSIHLVDFLSLLIALSIYSTYIRILSHNKVVHANLKMILIAATTIDMSLLLVRIFDFLDFSGNYSFGPTLRNTIKMICFSMGTLSLFNLLAERSLALFAYQWYDRPESARPHIIMLIYLLQLIFVLVIYRMVQNGGAAAAQLYVTVLFCCAIVALLTTLLYILSARARQNCVQKRRFDLTRHSISGQYQMAENRRCDRFIAIYIPYQVLSFFLTAILSGLLIFQVERKDPRSYLLYLTLFYLSIAPRVMLSMLIPLLRHSVLNKQFRQLLGRYSSRLSSSSYAPKPEYIIVHSTGGKPLTFPIEQETVIYFESYSAAWGRAGKTASHG